jgi:hypothetical protein
MFLKKTFDKRMKKYSLLEGIPQSLSNFESNFVQVDSNPPLFPYKPTENNNPLKLFSFKKPLPEEINSTNQLRLLDDKEWQNLFSLKNLRNSFNQREDLDFFPEEQKFPPLNYPQKIKDSIDYVKKLTDLDILKLNKKEWDNSSDLNIKNTSKGVDLEKVLFDLNHHFNDFKITPLKRKKYIEGVDSRDKYKVNNKIWNVSTNDEFNGIKSVELKRINDINELARNNSEIYWKKNEFNRRNKSAFKVSPERRKIEVKRYFKPYRTPYENTIDYINNMKRAKSLSQYEREEISKKVIHDNPGSIYPEKINALIEKEMFNIEREKYNQIIGKIDKKKLKEIELEKEKFKWNDSDLINKMMLLNEIKDINWFKKSINKSKNTKMDIKKEFLKPLVEDGDEIHKEEENIKDKLLEEHKRRMKHELLLKNKFGRKIKEKNEFKSKYPLTETQYKKEINKNKSWRYDKEDKPVNPNQIYNDDDVFIQAYHNVVKKKIEENSS